MADRMPEYASVGLFLLILIAAIVGVDLLFLKSQWWPRLVGTAHRRSICRARLRMLGKR